MKLGDLGISLKLDKREKDPKIEMYYLKGGTDGYLTKYVALAN